MSDSLVRHASWRITAVRRGNETAWVSHPYSPPSSAAPPPQALHFPIKHAEAPVPPSLIRRISAPDDIPLASASRPALPSSHAPGLGRSVTVPTRPSRTERLPSDSSVASSSSADSQHLLTPPTTPPASALHFDFTCNKPDHDHHRFGDYDMESAHMRVVHTMPDVVSGPSSLPFQYLNPSTAARHLGEPRSVSINPCDSAQSHDSGLFGPLSPPGTPLLRPIDLPARSTSSTPVGDERLNRFDVKRKCVRHRRGDTPRPVVRPKSRVALGLLGMETGVETGLISGGSSEESIAWVHFPDGRSA